MYSYFNLRLEDGEAPERVLDASIAKAYSDATQQGAYNTLIPKGDKENLSKKAKNKGYPEIKSAIQELLKKDSKLEFEKWHKDICEKLCGENGIYSDVCHAYGDDTFSYGNAQKWVNMSLKYLCILYEIYKEYNKESICTFCDKYGEKIKKYEKDFHVPVDSYIIKAVYDKREEGKGIELPLKKDEKGKKYGIEQYVSWSKWDNKDDEYTKFQKSLRNSNLLKDEDSPLDWENKEWIKQKANKKEK